jgi:6-pyruvoyltetrahydropterin/6-carboxytetrahydropterin synthase
MYILKAEHSFDSAHFLANYKGKCGHIHGHRWRVLVEVQGSELVDGGQLDGMIVDFGDLKKDVKEMADYYDHSLIIQKDTLRKETLNCLLEDGFSVINVEFRPTAENFSYHFYKHLRDKGYDVKRVTVYETPNNSATFEKGEV